MRKTRIIAFICAVIMLLSAVSFASAAGHKTARTLRIHTATQDSKTMGWDYWRTILNGEKVTFVLNCYPFALYEKYTKGYIGWGDLIFDCEGKVKAKTSASWIHIEKTKVGFILSFDINTTMKNRSGKVTVTGTNYKATLTFKQNGMDKIKSVKRSKKKVTLKLKYGASSKHWLGIYAYKTNDDGSTTSKTIVDKLYTKDTYTFTVEKGWSYDVNFGPAIKEHWGGGYDWCASGYSGFTVEKVTGSETYDITY